MVKKLTEEQKRKLAELAVKTAKQEGAQKVRRWTDQRDYDNDAEDVGPLFGIIHDHWPPF